MSMQPMPWPEPAPEVAAAVRKAYARRVPPLAVAVRDRLGELFPDAEFAQGYGRRGRPGFSPGRLALVTVLQMAENLTDRQAADACRDKISWKYALGLGLDDEGFDDSVLSEFRTRVVEHGLEQRVLDVLLERLIEQGLLGAGGTARTDSTHVIAAVRELNRLELAGESVRACLEAVAAAAPDWLAGVIDVADWGERYGARVDSWRLPSSKTKRDELTRAYGSDARALLIAIYRHPQAPTWLAGLPAVEVLRVMLVQNYVITTDAAGREVIRAREAPTDGLPPGRTRLVSPYDPDARRATKGDLHWTGYKIHLTEHIGDTPDDPTGDHPAGDDHPDCGDDPAGGDPAGGGHRGGGRGAGRDDERPGRPARLPNLITGVDTTEATVPDAKMLSRVHAALAERNLLPAEHLIDSGYPSAEALIDSSRRWGVTLISPLQADKSPQARAGTGYDRAHFTIDFDAQQATCPQGHTSSKWEPVTLRGTNKILIKFAAATCHGCPVRDQCTRSTSKRHGRQLTVPTREAYTAQQAARADQTTTEWRARYAARAGIEATIGQAIAVTATRRTRYRGLPKTRLEHIFSAVALNLTRLHGYWHGRPLDRTRTSHLTRLEQTLAA